MSVKFSIPSVFASYPVVCAVSEPVVLFITRYSVTPTWAPKCRQVSVHRAYQQGGTGTHTWVTQPATSTALEVHVFSQNTATLCFPVLGKLNGSLKTLAATQHYCLSLPLLFCTHQILAGFSSSPLSLAGLEIQVIVLQALTRWHFILCCE